MTQIQEELEIMATYIGGVKNQNRLRNDYWFFETRIAEGIPKWQADLLFHVNISWLWPVAKRVLADLDEFTNVRISTEGRLLHFEIRESAFLIPELFTATVNAIKFINDVNLKK